MGARANIPGPGSFLKAWSKCLPACLVIMSLTGCGPGPVIVYCSPEGPRVQQALEGLQEGLQGAGPLEVVWARTSREEAQAQFRRLRQRRPRLVVVLGTPALMVAAPMERRLPLVFALVADPYFTGAAYEPDHPEDHQGNVTGVASPPPLAQALEQGARLLGPRTWGMLYDPNDGVAVELQDGFLKEAPKFGLKPLTAASLDGPGDGRALQQLWDQGARVFYLPPAPSAARYASLLLAWGREGRAAVVSSLPEGEHGGALLWLTLDYRALGREAAGLARRVLAGENPARIPIMTPTPLRIEVDEGLLRRWCGYPAPR
jgi:putative ABC transport system substrate-binding protein